MFDQSFSAENYLSIFHEENRKGHIAFDDMPGLSGNLVGISRNLCKSIQKELLINDTP